VKLAAATVPILAGSVTPPAPPVLRTPAGVITTVPASEAETATLPKFISTFLTIVIGVMMVAEAEAEAVAWAKEEVAEEAITIAAIAITLEKFFILFVFWVWVICEFVCYCCLIGIYPTVCQKHNWLIIIFISVWHDDDYSGIWKKIPENGLNLDLLD
jgi:hypothetical protein